MSEETEKVVEEKVEETQPVVVEEKQPEKGLEAIKWLFAHTLPKPTSATRQHGNKKRGVGITRKDKSQSKKARNQSKKSRKINRGK